MRGLGLVLLWAVSGASGMLVVHACAPAPAPPPAPQAELTAWRVLVPDEPAPDTPADHALACEQLLPALEAILETRRTLGCDR